MRIGILSDSHDHVWNLRAALGTLAAEADVLLHCGDFCSPFLVPLLAEFPGPVHAVFGNNDADRYRLQLQAAKTGNVTLHGESFFAELGGRRFAMHHFDDVGRHLAATGEFDVVCFGHNHRLEIARVGACRLINPGAILGYQPADRADVDPTFVVLDTEAPEPVVWRVVAGRACEPVVRAQGSRRAL
ncbi:metallophosphoesterase [bacterium]|nr:metallophosphoesterase [bacterium]